MKVCGKIPGPPAQIPLFGSITDINVDSEGKLYLNLRN